MNPYVNDPDFTLYNGDALETLRELPSESVHCCLTSPPFFGLRDYGHEDQIGLEPTPDEWAAKLVAVFREVRRVLRDDGTLWVEVGDRYAASGGQGETGSSDGVVGRGPRGTRIRSAKPKDLLGQPFLLAFALRADGWYLRQAIIWHKPNAMPESVRDRCTTAHSYVFLLSKSPRYFFDAEAIAEYSVTGDPRRPYTSDGAWQMDGRALEQRHGGEPRNGHDFSSKNARSVWTIPTSGYSEAHFATWPPALVERVIRAGTSERGVCPECGAPWVREVEREPNPAGINGGEHREVGRDGALGKRERDLERERRIGASTTLGWTPRCDHGHEPILATVLDPFMGSGTTALVARKHGRRSIGIELNPDYCEMAARRLQQLSLLA